MANGLERHRARLLRSIIAALNARFGMSPTADRQRIYRHDPFHVRPDTDPGGSRELEVPRPPISVSMTRLVDEMDFSLDASFMDARFLDLGLLGWDEPGIFCGSEVGRIDGWLGVTRCIDTRESEQTEARDGLPRAPSAGSSRPS